MVHITSTNFPPHLISVITNTNTSSTHSVLSTVQSLNGKNICTTFTERPNSSKLESEALTA